MAIETGPDNELRVHQMDYMPLLRESEAAFDRGDMREGQRLLEMAAAYERKQLGSPSGAARPRRRRRRG